MRDMAMRYAEVESDICAKACFSSRPMPNRPPVARRLAPGGVAVRSSELNSSALRRLATGALELNSSALNA